ncbi:Franean1_4349 family RiPP [Oryzomonas sp.]|uniref:Franean1_4349 family RiPP n=1 Tax=Oryzomonas sp. TaxID=2855186 RepID=UPI0038D4FADC
MSQDSVERFLGRVITDEHFRQKASKSIKNACTKEGLTLSQREINLLEKVDLVFFGQVAQSIDDSIRRA